MAVGVVDRLETVEIDNTDRQPALVALRPLEVLGQVGEEPAPVRQGRQAVEIGDLEIFVAETARLGLRRDQAGEIA